MAGGNFVAPNSKLNNIPQDGNGWSKWGQHVLKELERQDKCIGELTEKINNLIVENALLKLKSGVWGAIGAAIPILIAIIIWLLTGGLAK